MLAYFSRKSAIITLGEIPAFGGGRKFLCLAEEKSSLREPIAVAGKVAKSLRGPHPSSEDTPAHGSCTLLIRFQCVMAAAQTLPIGDIECGISVLNYARRCDRRTCAVPSDYIPATDDVHRAITIAPLLMLARQIDRFCLFRRPHRRSRVEDSDTRLNGFRARLASHR